MTEPVKKDEPRKPAPQPPQAVTAPEDRPSPRVQTPKGTEGKSDADKALHKPAQAPKGNDPDHGIQNIAQRAVNTAKSDDDLKADAKAKKDAEKKREKAAEDGKDLALNVDGTELEVREVGGAVPGTKGAKAAAGAKEGSSVVEHKHNKGKDDEYVVGEIAVDPLSEIHDKDGGTSDESFLSAGEVEKANPQEEKGVIEGTEVKKSDIPPTGPDHSAAVVDLKEEQIAKLQRTYTYGDQG